jgi:dTDP-4-amino-4,6-dideoxygalactose transaminase
LHLEKAVYALEHNDKSVYPLPFTSGLRLKPKGIIPIDIFGLLADYETITRIATSNELFIIEDAAQSFGAEYDGKKACSLTDIGCTSFFPAKPLGCYGDGGMCFTDDKKLAEKLISIRSHGKGTHKYDNLRIGINGRLDTIQAAILLSKFSIFQEELQLRQKVAERYKIMLSNKSGLTVPIVPDRYLSAWAQYSVLADSEDQRSKLQANLKAAGIPTAIYYPKPLHLQTAFSDLELKEGTFPISEDYARRIFSLPMHPYLTDTDQEKIVAAMG